MGYTIDIIKLQADLHYDPVTGIFTWKVAQRSVKQGAKAGVIDKSNGYLKIGWNKRVWPAHRLAWIYIHGELNRHYCVKQRNNIRSDLRIENLYVISNAENRRQQNRDRI